MRANCSCAPLGLHHFPTFTHGLCRGLHSCAASRLGAVGFGQPWRPSSEFSRALFLLKLPVPDIGEMSRNSRSCCHHRTDQMRPPTTPLPSFKVSIAGGSTT